jgi:hypothetical protein
MEVDGIEVTDEMLRAWHDAMPTYWSIIWDGLNYAAPFLVALALFALTEFVVLRGGKR